VLPEINLVATATTTVWSKVDLDKIRSWVKSDSIQTLIQERSESWDHIGVFKEILQTGDLHERKFEDFDYSNLEEKDYSFNAHSIDTVSFFFFFF
jgi:hypothetical protein